LVTDDQQDGEKKKKEKYKNETRDGQAQKEPRNADGQRWQWSNLTVAMAKFAKFDTAYNERLMKEVMEEKMEGKRGPGRKRIVMMDVEGEWTGIETWRTGKNGEFGYHGPALLTADRDSQARAPLYAFA